MSLGLQKDPAKRLGGSALIRLPAGTIGSSTVTVRRSDTAEWLGTQDWQGERHAFGPYPVESDAKGAFLRIGPEIVNRMETYLPFRMALPDFGLEHDLDWPEDILPSPEGATGSGVGLATGQGGVDGTFGTKREDTPAPPPPVPQPEPVPAPPPKPTPPPQPEPAPQPQPQPEPPISEPVGEPARRMSPLVFVVPLLLIAAGAGWWFLSQQSPGPVVVPPPPPEPTLACVRDDIASVISAAEPNVGTMRELITLCRAAEDIDMEVRLWERLAALGDGEALLTFAKWYDPRETGAARPFGSVDPANAATYYKRAVEAGADGAAEALDQLCTHLRGLGTQSAQMVLTIHCE